MLNHSVFHLDWMWKYMYFKSNNTTILYKPRKVFNIPQAMSTFVDLTALRWRHNEHDCVSNHQRFDCLLNRLFMSRSKKTPKLRVTGLCVGNSPEPVNSPHKGPVTRKMFPFDDVIMEYFDLRAKQQAYLTRCQQCVCFCQKWLCILQHRINGSHLIIGS